MKLEKIKNEVLSGFLVAVINISKMIAIVSSFGIPINFGLRTTIFGGLSAMLLKSDLLVPSGSIITIVLLQSINYKLLPIYSFTAAIILFFILINDGYQYIALCPNQILDGYWLVFIIGTFFSQFNHIFQIHCSPKSYSNVIEKIIDKSICFQEKFNNINYYSAIFYFSMLILLFYLNNKNHNFPWFAIFLLLGIVFSMCEDFFGFSTGFKRIISKDQNIDMELFDFIDISIFDLYKLVVSLEFYTTSFSIALLSLLDSYITIRTLERISKTKIIGKSKDFVSIFVVNLTSILTGVLPISFVTGLTALNFYSGGKTKLSAIFNGITCLLLSYIGGKFLKYVPVIFLDIILITLVILVTDFKNINNNLKNNTKNRNIMLITIIVSLLFSGSLPIIIGTLIFLGLESRYLMKTNYEIKVIKQNKTEIRKYSNFKISFVEINKFIKSENEIYKMIKQGSLIDCKTINFDDNKYNCIEKNYLLKEYKIDEIRNSYFINSKNNILRNNDDILLYRIHGNLTYINIDKHIYNINKLKFYNLLIVISFKYMNYFDDYSIMKLSELSKNFNYENVNFTFFNLKDKKLLKRLIMYNVL